MTRVRSYTRRPDGFPHHHWMAARCLIDPETDCWYGYGSAVRGGYRRMRGPSGRMELVHRVAYEGWIGSIPEGLEIDHVALAGCDRRDCFNPAHLEVVDRRTNILRGALPEMLRKQHAAITHCPQGHEYTPENTYVSNLKNGHQGRTCITCRQIRDKGRPREGKRKRTAA